MASKEYHKEYYKNNKDKWPWLKDKTLAKSRKLKHYYGITLAQYDILLEAQNGKCAICKNLPEKQMLAVDHDHVTKRVRGLLCRGCNTTLGFLKENVDTMESMIAYVKLHRE